MLASAVAAAATCYCTNCMPKNATIAAAIAGRLTVLANNFYNRLSFHFLREIRNKKGMACCSCWLFRTEKLAPFYSM